MKVYLLSCAYYDYCDYSGGSALMGIYSSLESAIAARDALVADEVAECHEMHCTFEYSLDADNNPVIDKFDDGQLFEGNVYTIAEWPVQ